MARKRIVEVEVESEGSPIWWILAGTAAGVAIGVIAAERMSGRPLSARSLLRKARRLVKFASGKWAPLLDVALELKDAWAERRAEKERDDEPDEYDDDDFEVDVEVDLDDDPEDGEEEEEEEEEDDDEEEEEFGEEADAGGLDEDAEADAEDDEDHPIAARVLEAFLNDPVLAERSVEIDADDRGNVFLHGRVRTAREVAHAVTIAGGVPGVTDVRQRLRVRDRR